MSRAFVKEPDGDAVADDQPELPQSPHPNYVTAAGLAQLEARLAALSARRGALGDGGELGERLQLAQLQREIRWLEARIERAILVDPAAQPADQVAFGAIVTVAEEDGRERDVAIVGEDEADAAHGRVSWVSPLAKALLGAEVGDLVTWPRPSGNRELEVLAIRYPAG